MPMDEQEKQAFLEAGVCACEMVKSLKKTSMGLICTINNVEGCVVIVCRGAAATRVLGYADGIVSQLNAAEAAKSRASAN